MAANFRHLFRTVTGMLALTANICLAAADADKAAVESGRKLASEAKCEACHMSKIGGDGSQIYTRRERRVTTRSKLLPQVARCNSELSLGLFPEDEAAIAAYLNEVHYKFKD